MSAASSHRIHCKPGTFSSALIARGHERTFAKLQQAIFDGQHDAVVVFKLDRLSRSLRDGINVLTDWLEKDIRVVAVTQQLDFSGAVGKMIAGVLFAVAEMEQETRRERQAEGIAAARANGVYLGRRPGTTKAKPHRAKQLLAKGLKHSEIAEAMGVSRRTVIRYLSSSS